jgi:hypothetical protein
MIPVKESSSKGEFLKRMVPVNESSSKREFLKRMVSPFTGTFLYRNQSFQVSISPTIPGQQPFSPQIILWLFQSNSVVQSKKKRKHALNLFSDIFKYFLDIFAKLHNPRSVIYKNGS